MSDYQEVSGFYGQDQWDRQTEFWIALQDQLIRNQNATSLDLSGGERLCSIALIKRFLPNVIRSLPLSQQHQSYKPAEDSIVEDLGERSHWPSLGFIAALPWLNRLDRENIAERERSEFISIAQQEDDLAFREQDSTNPSPKRAFRYWPAEKRPAKHFKVDWATVDASAWFRTGLLNNEPKLSEKRQQNLIHQLESIYKLADKKPCPFYALLFMDGDSMGALLDKLKDSTLLSERLDSFSSQVEEIVYNHFGRTVYAGGDDVLAFVSAKNALALATKLSESYRDCFADTDAAGVATLSGTIVFAHWRFPLSQVTQMAHRFLDDVAKDGDGPGRVVHCHRARQRIE